MCLFFIIYVRYLNHNASVQLAGFQQETKCFTPGFKCHHCITISLADKLFTHCTIKETYSTFEGFWK